MYQRLMQLTTNYIQQKFDTLNAMCFGGKLPPLPIEISRARTFLGALRFEKKKKPFGGYVYTNLRLVVSTRIALLETEREVEDVILHEMIHYFIIFNNHKDTAPHGVLFRDMMGYLNERYGRNVTISYKLPAAEKAKEMSVRQTKIRQHFVCVVHFCDGRTGVTVSARTRLFQLWDALPHFGGVKMCQWYVSVDPFFNRFPRAQSLKVYSVTREELDAHLLDAQRLERQGNVIKVRKD